MDRIARLQTHLVPVDDASDPTAAAAAPAAGVLSWLSSLFGGGGDDEAQGEAQGDDDVAEAPQSALSEDGEVIFETLMVPMRDGPRLCCLLARPASGGPYPVLFTQRYAGDGSDPGSTAERERMAREGFAVGFVTFRGAHRSEGHYEGYHTLAQDGHDVCEWLAAQPWSNGKVGTFGGSQGGMAQNLLASTSPPSLVCQYNVDTGMSMFHEAFRHGGGGQRGPAAFGGGILGGVSEGRYDAEHRQEIQPAVRQRVFLRHFIQKMIILPRQARNKHRENSKQTWCLTVEGPPFLRRVLVRQKTTRRVFSSVLDLVRSLSWQIVIHPSKLTTQKASRFLN
jgi:predicted acyl esterase